MNYLTIEKDKIFPLSHNNSFLSDFYDLELEPVFAKYNLTEAICTPRLSYDRRKGNMIWQKTQLVQK